MYTKERIAPLILYAESRGLETFVTFINPVQLVKI
jgi:hypothetical protein